MSADYEIWHAAHEDCPPYGCGKCVVIDLDWTEEQVRQITAAAALLGDEFDVFVHKAVVAGMNKERLG